jgi:RNA polymerase sigma-70 factor (ECF subfamily)
VAGSPAAWSSEDAFARAVGPHLPALLGLARRALGSDDVAWEAVQDSLLCLWRQEAPPPQIFPWLVRAVVNRTRHLRRTGRRRARNEERAPACFWTGTPTPDPYRHAEQDALALALGQAVGALPPEQRAVFVLKEIDGADYESIARSLHVPLGTVRSRLHRARGALRECLAPLAPARGHGVQRRHDAHRHSPAGTRRHGAATEGCGTPAAAAREGIPPVARPEDAGSSPRPPGVASASTR